MSGKYRVMLEDEVFYLVDKYYKRIYSIRNVIKFIPSGNLKDHTRVQLHRWSNVISKQHRINFKETIFH